MGGQLFVLVTLLYIFFGGVDAYDRILKTGLAIIFKPLGYVMREIGDYFDIAAIEAVSPPEIRKLRNETNQKLLIRQPLVYEELPEGDYFIQVKNSKRVFKLRHKLAHISSYLIDCQYHSVGERGKLKILLPPIEITQKADFNVFWTTNGTLLNFEGKDVYGESSDWPQMDFYSDKYIKFFGKENFLHDQTKQIFDFGFCNRCLSENHKWEGPTEGEYNKLKSYFDSTEGEQWSALNDSGFQVSLTPLAFLKLLELAEDFHIAKAFNKTTNLEFKKIEN